MGAPIAPGGPGMPPGPDVGGPCGGGPTARIVGKNHRLMHENKPIFFLTFFLRL